MTYGKSTGTLTAAPNEIINLIKSAKFDTRLNKDYNQAQIDILTKYGTDITPGQVNWLLNTRINYANKSPTPNIVNQTTQGKTVNTLSLVD